MEALRVSEAQLSEYCRRWKIADFTVARSTGPETHALTCFARFEPTAEWTLSERIQMQEELQELIGKPVRIESRHAYMIRNRSARSTGVLYNA